MRFFFGGSEISTENERPNGAEKESFEEVKNNKKYRKVVQNQGFG